MPKTVDISETHALIQVSLPLFWCERSMKTKVLKKGQFG